jgi:hypothetical protein
MGKKPVRLPTYTCLRCGHVWYPRKPFAPAVCPACKSPYWHLPRWQRAGPAERLQAEADVSDDPGQTEASHGAD